MAQTLGSSYNAYNTQKAVAGGKYDIRPDTVITRACESTVIPFGRAVTTGTIKDKQGKIVTTAGDKFVGVALKLDTIPQDQNTVAGYAQFDAMSVLKEGAVWVEVTATVAAEDAAYVEVATGKFTNVSTNNLAVPGGKFESNAASGGLAVLSLT